MKIIPMNMNIQLRNLIKIYQMILVKRGMLLMTPVRRVMLKRAGLMQIMIMLGKLMEAVEMKMRKTGTVMMKTVMMKTVMMRAMMSLKIQLKRLWVGSGSLQYLTFD